MPISDKEIIHRVTNDRMIKPFHSKQVEKNVISSGLSASGYDARIGYEFKVFKTPAYTRDAPRTWDANELPSYVYDPKNPNENLVGDVRLQKGEVLILYPGEYAIGATIEYFQIPRDIVALVIGKSTYARSQILINCTPAEAGWEGHLAVEIANIGSCPVAIYGGEGICQFLFFTIEGEVLVSYADKAGKYNHQKATELLSKVK